jgi:hypothetical protein
MKLPHLLFLLIVGVALLALTMAPVHFVNSTSVPAAASARRIHQPTQALFFEQNVGQMDRSVQFIAHGSQYDLLLSDSGMAFKPKEGVGGAGQQPVDDGTVALSFGGGSGASKAEGSERQPAVMNYYVGTDRSRWYSGVPTFAQVRYKNVFSGIDLLFHEKDGGVEFDFQVAPGSDPQQIRLKLDGPYAFSGGDLLVGEQAWMRIQKPRAYQIFDGHQREVSTNYVVTNGELRVGVGEYDRSRSLIIDPSVRYQGFVPGTGTLGFSIVAAAADAAGNAYLVGFATPGANKIFNCAITKFSSTGTIVYQTIYGPIGLGNCNAIAADAQGNAYITGLAIGTVPTTPGVVEPTCPGTNDAFAAKFNTSGKLVYGTCVGGSAQDSGAGIAVDANGNAYLTGTTTSNDFPLVNPFQSSLSGPSDAFVSVLNPSASAFVYSTYLGGSSNDQGSGVAVDSTGEAYITGFTQSTDFPLKNPLLPSCTNPCNIQFLTKFDSTGSSLVYSTYLNLAGSSNPAIALDQAGDAFVGAGQSIISVSPSDTLNFQGTIPIYLVPPTTCGVGVDAAGNAYLGCNASIDPKYINDNPMQGTGSSFVVSFTNSGAMNYATDVDGVVTGVAGAEAGNVYLAGTFGNGGGPYFSVNMNQGASNAFIAKIQAQGAPALAYYPPWLAFGYQQIGVTSQPQTVAFENLTSSGTLDLNSIVVSGPGFATGMSTCGSTLPPVAAVTCTYSVTFTPQDANPANGAITITDNSLGSPHVIPLSGQGATPVATLNPTSLSFPDTIVGQSSSAMAVTMTNTGHATLTISHISISGDFNESNTCGASLSAGQNCSINVTFTPTALGTRNGAVTIADNASNSPQMIPLSGTGISGSLNLGPAPGGSTSATVQAGQPAGYQLSIGGAGLSGTASLSCTGAPTGAACSVPSSMNINASTATPFSVSVTTTSRIMSMLHPGNPRSRWLWATSLFCLVILPIGRRKKQLVFIGRGLPILLLLLICSCGGSGSSSGSTTNPNGTPAGTYQLTVAAKSGSVSQSIMLTLKVE